MTTATANGVKGMVELATVPQMRAALTRLTEAQVCGCIARLENTMLEAARARDSASTETLKAFLGELRARLSELRGVPIEAPAAEVPGPVMVPAEVLGVPEPVETPTLPQAAAKESPAKTETAPQATHAAVAKRHGVPDAEATAKDLLRLSETERSRVLAALRKADRARYEAVMEIMDRPPPGDPPEKAPVPVRGGKDE